MGLSSIFSTAITGLTAAETTIDVVGNNVANSNTNGFKASQAHFATQFLQTLSLGSSPTTNNAGTNPRQIGLGAQVSAITPNFTQGTIQISSNASDLALQGDGFFIVQASSGEHLYTRNGAFQLNSRNELVTASGERVLGFGIDQSYNIQSTTLKALDIPLGSASVAQATKTATMAGTLISDGAIATKAEIVESGVLGDGSSTRPTNSTAAALAAVPDAASTTTAQSTAAGSLAAGDVYRYKIVFADGSIASATPTESLSSTALGPVTITGTNNVVTLNNLPTDPSGGYGVRRIYRTDATGTGAYHYVGEVLNNTAGQSFVDGTSAAGWASGQALDTTALTGNYNYYVTFASALGGPPNGTESRPSQLITPPTISGGRAQLSNLPTDSSGQFTVRRIYRNLANNPTEFFYVGELDNNLPNQTFTDNKSDSSISSNTVINLNGPTINYNTHLVDIVQRNANDGYDSPFTTGLLTFKGQIDGREINPPKTLAVTSTTTVLDLINFQEQAFGIQKSTSSNGIPIDASGLFPGGTISDGRIRLVANNGVGNKISIGTGDFILLPSSGNPSQPNLGFSSAQKAVGESATADFVVYDSLGVPANVRVTAVLAGRDANSTTYRWYAASFDNDPSSGVQSAVGTGLITFDGSGHLVPGGNTTVSVERAHSPADKPLNFTLDFTKVSGLADPKGSSLQATGQDGQPPGQLTNYNIGDDGKITGDFDNGFERDLGQIRLARFANNAGLVAKGENLYSTGVNSGLPIEGNPGQQGIGQIVTGAVELSNTDISKNLIDLITASTQYRGNARVITAAQQLLDELLNLRR